MGNRRRRSYSRRMKNSSSSKKSVMPYIFPKHNQSNSVCYKEEPVREKRLKAGQKPSTYASTTEHTLRGVKIVTSVSVDNMEETLRKITFQQSRQPLCENPHHSLLEVTNSININCTGLHVKLEMKEIIQHNTLGIQTTLVIHEKGDDTDKCVKSTAEKNETHEKHHTSHDTFNSTSEDGTNDPICATNNSNWDQHQQISTSLETLMKANPSRKERLLRRSFSNDLFWNVQPQELADMKYNTLEDLAYGLASFKISSSYKADAQQGRFDPTPFSNCSEEAGRPSSVEAKGKASFEEFPQSGSYESMRPWLSTTSCGFVNDLTNCQKGKPWIPNNSTAGHREVLFPPRRCQTFPCMSKAASLMQEDPLLHYGKQFSTGTVSHVITFPLQTNSLGIAVSHDGKPTPSSMTCNEDNPNDEITVSDKNSLLQDPDDCADKVYKHEMADSDLDQEMGDLECHSPDLAAGQQSGRARAIEVTPPSCSGSEEHAEQSRPLLSLHNNEVQIEKSIAEAKTSLPEQRFLQMHSSLGLGSCVQKHVRPSSDVSLLDNINGPSLSSNDDIHLKAPSERTADTTLALRNEKTRSRQDECNKPALSASCAGQTKEHPNKSDKPVSRCSLESKDHLTLVSLRDADCSMSDSWARRRKAFEESKQRGSAGGSSFTSDVTEETVSEDTHTMDMATCVSEDRGFYAETFHSAAWIYQGDNADPSGLRSRSRAVSIRERTVKINKRTGEYPWGFRIQFSKPIVVTEVDTNGAAEEAGLMVGDYVLAVNGTDVRISHSEAADLVRQGPDELVLTIGSDIAHSPNTPRPACRGYLHKRTQSGLIKGWRKRWFVLTHECCLYYYRHKRDEGKSQALAALKMEGAEVGLDFSLGKPFVLKCRPLAGNRVFYLCATSNQEIKRWLEAMDSAIHPIIQHHVWVDVTRHNGSLPPLAVKSPESLGLLHKMDKSKDVWVQHYCILKDGCLYLYSGIRATHAHGGIYLQGYTVREQPFGSKKSTIELKPPSDEFKTFYFCAENPNENKRWIVALKASIKKWLPLHRALQDNMNGSPEAPRT
ncbi:uncharacterized protein pdzph1 isoform X3 [Dunckerocampus dactyliophorus]|uniref:uncharacterized protein pdzph1 isoform X3 n=1 Tax=Dunckerocampus dactyliophorus TaxID=161453 RepID=UPI002407738B|nr:uncharacterized protein pdzph1 isoform X3 [Dunckerocampus dactyliophorus]